MDGRRLVQRVAERHERLVAHDDPAVCITVADRDDVLAAARHLDADAPLAGLVFAVKDNIDVAGLPTTAAFPPYRRVPSVSSPVVARLQAAGAVVVGKANLDQFATGLVGTRSPYGAPRNPVDASLAPGGSSSGSAVAVAAGLVDFALGTDTAGSGRVPAAQCRIVGLKPTRGRLSTRAVVPAVRSVDCLSIFAADVAGAWRVFECADGFDPLDPYARAVPPGMVGGRSPRRVGTVVEADLDGDMDRAAWRAALARMAALDVDIVEVDLEPFLTAARLLYEGCWLAERYCAVGPYIEQAQRHGAAGIDPVVAAVVGAGRTVSAEQVFRDHHRLAELRRATERTWATVDALLLPTTPGVATLAEVAAEPVGRNSRLGTYTNFANLLDLCAVAVPGPDRPDGLPFGVQLIGPAFHDAGLATLAARCNGEQPPGRDEGWTELVVVGAHLSGEPLNGQLTERGGQLVARTRTSNAYRLFALDTEPAKPGLVRVDRGGAAIEVEVWRLAVEEVGGFLALVPPPLCIGTVRLADGSLRQGFLCESAGLDGGARDITSFGGWRAYRHQLV